MTGGAGCLGGGRKEQFVMTGGAGCLGRGRKEQFAAARQFEAGQTSPEPR